ncbi:hypothetical protein GX48_02390 [Paracoccidioides brasiliensis]|nr:hypothetical protein GX48_02390 [Paracoccidioides brasiliensis]
MAEIETPDVDAEEQHREDQVTVDPGIEDTDSAYGDELSIYTASVTSSVTDFQKRYHASKEGRYLIPNDEQENDRLDMHHALIRATLKEKLYLAPIRDAPGRVIDICTGTGIWAIEFADLFPSAEVLGNDLSPIQPKLCLKPGGWVEFQDWDAMMQSADGTGKGSYIEQYITRTLAAFEKAGYIVRPGIFLEKWMKDTGFVNVKVTKFIVPLGAWAKDKHYFEQTLEASAMAALTRIENWTKEEVDFLIAKTKNDARNPKIHSEFHLYVIYPQILFVLNNDLIG